MATINLEAWDRDQRRKCASNTQGASKKANNNSSQAFSRVIPRQGLNFLRQTFLSDLSDLPG